MLVVLLIYRLGVPNLDLPSASQPCFAQTSPPKQVPANAHGSDKPSLRRVLQCFAIAADSLVVATLLEARKLGSLEGRLELCAGLSTHGRCQCYSVYSNDRSWCYSAPCLWARLMRRFAEQLEARVLPWVSLDLKIPVLG